MRRTLCILLTPLPLLLVAVPAQAAAWRPPVEPTRVLSPFAPGAANWDPGHRGVDLAAAPGTWVSAARTGTVVFAGELAGRGVVSIDHGALRTTYEPLDPLVSDGERVYAGEIIGRIAESGGHCRCLHWGLKRGSTYLDPMALLRRIVLKPL